MLVEKLADILKAGTLPALALALAAGALLIGFHRGVVPIPGDPFLFGTWAALAIGTTLTLTGALKALSNFVKPGVWIVRFRDEHDRKREAKQYLGHMTDHDREIVAYLLHHNQKTFTGAADGGYARELIARGLINRALRPGYAFYPDDTPFVVNEQAWKVLVKHRDQFPYQAASDAPYPWRVPWQLQ
ncbi:MAG: hypothetical protein EON90_09255 [Brevundimonas sp.]|nr:MAG: hypothetical protein EON90_09255 [Brevundimonas sp.]